MFYVTIYKYKCFRTFFRFVYVILFYVSAILHVSKIVKNDNNVSSYDGGFAYDPSVVPRNGTSYPKCRKEDFSVFLITS